MTEEENIERKVIYKLLGLIAICFTICFTAFKAAKVAEYRPIVVGYRIVALNTAYQPSLSRVTAISVTCKIVCTSSLAGGQDGSIALQVSADNGVTDPYVTISQIQNNNSVALAIALTVVNGQSTPLVGSVKAGYYYKLVSTSATGSPVFSVVTPSQETQQ